VAASCRTGRKDRTQLHDALLSRGPIAKTGATLRSVRKKLQGRVRGAAGDLPAEADERLAAASALLWWCDCNVNSEKRRAGKAPSRLYGTGSWAGGNRGRRAGEAGSWLFPVKGIPAHSPRGASTRKTRAWFNGKPSSRPNGRELALPPGGLAFSRGGDACAGERAADPLDGLRPAGSLSRPHLCHESPTHAVTRTSRSLATGRRGLGHGPSHLLREASWPYPEEPAVRADVSCKQWATSLGSFQCSGRTPKMGRAVPGRKPVVLVVEDENLIRLSALDMVEEAGFEAIAASDADEAIRILESRNDIRAVFTDVHMPGSMDGLRLARVVRNRWPPVALIVTSGRRSVLETDLPPGGRFLDKPYEPTQIEAALRELIC
jgi:CheY-like chemotaxis protein